MATEYGFKFVLDYPGVSKGKDLSRSSSRGAVNRARNWHLCFWRNRDYKRNVLTFHGPSNYFTVKRAEAAPRTVKWNNVHAKFRVIPVGYGRQAASNPGGGGPR